MYIESKEKLKEKAKSIAITESEYYSESEYESEVDNPPLI